MIISTNRTTLSSGTPNNGVRKVVAVMGQSNIDGRNTLTNFDNIYPQFENPTSKIKTYISSQDWIDWDCSEPPITNAINQRYSADTQAFQILSDRLNETIYAVKKSKGNTGFMPTNDSFGDWNINSREYFDHFLPFIRRVQNTKTFVEDFENRTFRMAALWMDIGENNSNQMFDNTNTKEETKTWIKEFLDYMIAFSGNYSLPIIWRKLGLYQREVPQEFLDLQEELAVEYPSMILIPNTGFTLYDSYHLDHPSTLDYATQVADHLEVIYNNINT